MIPVSDFVDEPSHQPGSNAESRHSDSLLVDDIFGPDRQLERTNKFRPKSGMNLKKALPKPIKSCTAEVQSSTSQIPDSFGIKSTVEVSVGANCLEGSVCSTMVSPVHCVVQDLTSDSEMPISTNVLNGVAQLDSGCSQQGKHMACHSKPLDGDAQAASNSVLMVPVSDFVDDLSHQPDSIADSESRHGDYLIIDDVFGPDRQLERMNKFRPKPRMNFKKTLPNPIKSCAAEVPSPTSQVPDSFGIKSTVEVSAGASCLEGSVCFTMVSPAPCVVEDLRSDCEIPISSNVLNGAAQLDRGCSQQEKDMVCHLKSLDDDAQVDSSFGTVDDNQPNNIPLCESTESLGSDNPTHGCFESVEDLTQGFSSLIDSCSSEFNANVGLCSTLDVVILVKPAHHVANSSQSCSVTQISEEKTALYNDEDLAGSLFDDYPICETASLLSSTFIDQNNGGHTNEEPLAELASSDLPTSAEMVNAIVQQTSATVQSKIASNSSSCSGGIESVCTLKPGSAGSQQVVISSVVTDNPLVNNAYDENMEASFLSESHVNLQACSDKLETVSTTGVSSMDCIDDLLYQHVPSDVKHIGKFRPKPAVRLKDVKKTKSVSFITPNPGESAAPVDCQTTLNPTETAPSFLEMSEDNMEDGFISLPTSNKDNHVNLECSLSEAVMDISSLDSTDMVHKPVLNSDQHVSNFIEEIQFKTKSEITRVAAELGTTKFDTPYMVSGATTNASICPVDIKSGYARLDSPTRNNELLDAHFGFTSGDLANSLTMQGHSSFPSNSSEEGVYLASTCDLGVQSLADNVNFCTTEGEHGVDNVVEPNLEGTCTANTTQSDESRRLPWNLRQRNKFGSNTGNNIVSEDQIAENTRMFESDEENGADVDKDEDMPKKKKRKAPCKSVFATSGQHGSTKNRKASEKTYPIVKDPPKKRLPHGSRRKSAKRQVDKALLEIPDDELDRSQIAIRDLIRLAEFKERTSNKEAAALKISFTGLSDPFAKVNNVNDEDYNEEHKEDSNGDGANEGIQLEASKLNYHSYMKRPKQTRWSKMDTELFYQAIRQFGTNFAMIQLLFANRSRQQMKAKFKNEQRKHPLEIADALVNRGKDNSQFEKVIQHLKEQNLSKDACSNQTTKSQEEADQNEEEKADPEKKEQEVDSFKGGEAWNSPKPDDVYEFQNCFDGAA